MGTVQTDVARQGKVVVITILLAFVVLGYVAITWLTGDTRKRSHVSSVQVTAKGTPTTESEHYAQVLDRYNKQKASAAVEAGDSYLSVMSSRADIVPEQGESTQSQKPPPVQVPSQFPQPIQPVTTTVPQSSQQNWRQDAQLTKEASEQAQGLMGNWAAVAHSVSRVSTDAAEYAKSISPSGAAPQALTGAAPSVKIVEDFALVPATLKTDIDTDENSVVRARIASGQYAGAEVFALGYKRLTNTVDMTFTFMNWRGRSYKVTAKPFDQITGRTSLSGEVNNRYFSRIILPAITAGIGRAGQLYEQANAQNIITPQGGIIQTYPEKPNPTAVTGTIIGGIGHQGAQVLANDASNMPIKQVLIPAETTIGVQFIGPVLSSDEISPGATAPTQQGLVGADALSVLGQPAGQPPRQNQGVQMPPQGNATTYGMTGLSPVQSGLATNFRQ